MGSILMHDEELAARAVVRAALSCPGDNAAGVLQLVIKAVCRKFALDAVAGAAGAVAIGVAALDHKAGDDAVEGEAVVEALTGEVAEIANALGREIGVELKLDNSAVLHGDGCVDLVHKFFSFGSIIGFFIGRGRGYGGGSGGRFARISRRGRRVFVCKLTVFGSAGSRPERKKRAAKQYGKKLFHF